MFNAHTIFTSNIGFEAPEKLLKIKITNKKPSLYRESVRTNVVKRNGNVIFIIVLYQSVVLFIIISRFYSVWALAA